MANAETIAEVAVAVGLVGLDSIGAGLSKIKGMIGGGLVGLLGIGSLGAAMAAGVAKFAAMETRIVAMKSALSSTGQEVDGNVAKFQKLAAQLQQTTNASKGQTLDLITQGLHLGLNAEKAAEFAKAATGLATITGGDASDALRQLTQEANGATSRLGKMIPELTGVTDQNERLAIIQKKATQGIQEQMAQTHTLSGTWEHLQQSVGSVIGAIGGVLGPIVEAFLGQLSDFVDWIKTLIATAQEFGAQMPAEFGSAANSVNGAWASIKSAAGTALEWIKEIINAIVFSVMNWDLTTRRVGLNIAEAFTNLWLRIQTFAINCVEIFQWFCGNWKDILKTDIDFQIAIITNLGKNIMAIWDAVINYIKGKGFKPNFTPMLEGFESSIKKMPQLTAFKATKEFEAAFRQLDKETADRMQKWQKATEHQKAVAEQTKQEAKEAVQNIQIEKVQDKKEKEKKSGTTSQFTGIVDAWKAAQTAILKDNDKIPAEHLKVAKEHSKKLDKIVTKLGNGFLAVAG